MHVNPPHLSLFSPPPAKTARTPACCGVALSHQRHLDFKLSKKKKNNTSTLHFRQARELYCERYSLVRHTSVYLKTFVDWEDVECIKSTRSGRRRELWRLPPVSHEAPLLHQRLHFSSEVGAPSPRGGRHSSHRPRQTSIPPFPAPLSSSSSYTSASKTVCPLSSSIHEDISWPSEWRLTFTVFLLDDFKTPVFVASIKLKDSWLYSTSVCPFYLFILSILSILHLFYL